MRKIKIIIDTVYSITKQRDLSQYLIPTLDQCKKLTSEQCSKIWMTEVLPIMKSKLGNKQTGTVLKALVSRFLQEGYKATDTIGDIIVGKNAVQTPSASTQKVLDDMKATRARNN